MIFGAILAGGKGKRMGNHDVPKQFISICGLPIIIRTIRHFLDNKRIDIVYTAINSDWLFYAKKLFNTHFSEKELRRLRIVCGGVERLDSFINIIEAIYKNYHVDKNDILICHDSVRPFVTQEMINDCIDSTLLSNFALTVVPVTDTIHKSSGEEFIDAALERTNLFSGQTPSGFKIQLLRDILEQASEEDKICSTGTTQLVLKAGYKIRKVKGHPSNFKITTDNDLGMAEKIISEEKKTRRIELLDCTLRDGGIVIDFNFGSDRMQSIKNVLEHSGVQYVECGYINSSKGSLSDRTCFVDEQAIKSSFLFSKKKDTKYLAMIDYGTFDLNKLKPRDKNGIDGIRFAFHKEVWKDAIKEAKRIVEKGYDLFVQPMVTLRYSDEEFLDLIDCVNKELPNAYGVYIVDSFGQMDGSSLLRMIEIADKYVTKNMKIGFHAHNNRQLAFSNACELIRYNAKHDIILDSSIMGMGKGAGNLCTELIIPVLISEGTGYDSSSIYCEISDYFSKEIKEHPWGYCLEYYLSSLYGCTPSYINIFSKDKRMTTDILVDLLKNMPQEKKVACDKEFANEYLHKYFSGEK